MPNLKDRIIDFRRVRASELKAHPGNWRRHPKGQREALQNVLDDIGFAGAVLTFKDRDGNLRLVDGHLRVETAGDAEVPVLVTDLSEDEAKKLLAVYDPIGELADKDVAALADLMEASQADPVKGHHVHNLAQGNLRTRDLVEELADKVPEHTTNRYRAIVVDIPWNIEVAFDRRYPRRPPWPTLSLTQLRAVEMPAERDAHLFAWTLQPKLEITFSLCREWGFTPQCTLAWFKRNRYIKPPGRPRYNVDFVVMAARGKPQLRDYAGFVAGFDFRREITGSVKPPEFFNMIRQATNGPRVSIWGHQDYDGFDSIGFESKNEREGTA